MNIPAKLSAAFLGLILTGCATGPMVTADRAQDVDFSKYTSFAMMPREASRGNGILLGPTLIRSIEDSLRTGMTGKGYDAAPAARADLLVNFQHATETHLDTGHFGYSTHRWSTTYVHSPSLLGRAMGRRSTVHTVHMGTGFRDSVRAHQENVWIVDLVDAKSNELIWRGWARESTPPDRLTPERASLIMSRILEKVPNRQGTSG